MKRLLLSLIVCTVGALSAFGAGRTAATVSRNSGAQTNIRQTTARTAPVSRSTTANPSVTRVARTRRTGTTTARGAITTAATRVARRGVKTAPRKTVRASILPVGNVATNTFDDNYQSCQQAYFTCMDQFCALQNEKYRRCACSSKLESIMSRERALSNASGEIQDFKSLNIESILKTPAEVKAMLHASTGEATLSNVRDNSESAKKLTAINDVLNTKKTAATSTAGQLDIGGDIKQIWTTTDLISGDTIANLTGPALFSAVNSQCIELVRPTCPSESMLQMIKSAYGMYVENDCAILLTELDKKATAANATIRETRREMATARIDNYNAHNAVSINDCVAAVREKLTDETACGPDYVHCLDMTGLYLNRATGEPIYSPRFFKLATQLSISGDILVNSQNAQLVAELNRKKEFASKTLEECRDISDDVWQEFLRTAVSEIYQEQQAKVRQVKDECMDVVNQCYDTTVGQLRDFSNLDDQMLLGSRLVLAEEMCQDKLTTCSNLYGGGEAGFELLLAEMQQITDQKIAQNCLAALQDYAQKLCRTASNDLHGYPYGCRVYEPGGKTDAADANTLYSKMKTYAGQYCVRPNDDDTETEIPLNILGNVNMIMDSIRDDMAHVLATECEKLDGKWTPVFDEDDVEDIKHPHFYTTTNASTQWGLCALAEEE